jgi:ketosteroid isomerase-like protein
MRRSSGRAVVLGLGLCLPIAISCGGRESVEVAGRMRSAGAEWDRLFNSGDAALLAALYAEDAISMPFNAPTVEGRHALQAEFDKFFAENAGRHETLVDELLATDDWAIERARYVLTYTPRSTGIEVRETGRHIVCRKRHGDTWPIAWELWNTDTPPPP